MGDLTAFLQGAWQLRRRIGDLNLNLRGRFDGRAVFVARPDGLEHHEAGQLRFGSYTGPAARGYRYLKTSSPARLDVHFGDGRFFHSLDLSGGKFVAHHACGADCYVGRFKVLPGGLVSVRWSVVGPKKRLLITTQYRRAL